MLGNQHLDLDLYSIIVDNSFPNRGATQDAWSQPDADVEGSEFETAAWHAPWARW